MTIRRVALTLVQSGNSTRSSRTFAGRGGAVIYLSSEIEEFFDFADCVLVFRNKTVFKTFPSANFSEHALLAAMFGDLEGSTQPSKMEGAKQP